MRHAHPGISPMNFKVKPEDPVLERFSDLARRIYTLVYKRSLASLAPHPVWEECRRIGTIGDAVVAVGWTEILEQGWVEFIGEVALPVPALPSARSEPPAELKWVMDVSLEQQEPRLTLQEVLSIMHMEGIGRPSTYAKMIENVVVKNEWLNVSPDGYVTLTENGWNIVRELEDLDTLPQLNGRFTQNIEYQLDAVEQGKVLPSRMLMTLVGIVDESVVKDLGWIDSIGEPLAGEPADLSYANRENSTFVPNTAIMTENPEETLASDDPTRHLRGKFIAALIQSTGRAWWQKSTNERAALAVHVMMISVALNLDTFRKRLQYDALVRWMLGITEGVTQIQLHSAGLWWEKIDEDNKRSILEYAREIIDLLHLN